MWFNKEIYTQYTSILYDTKDFRISFRLAPSPGAGLCDRVVLPSCVAFWKNALKKGVHISSTTYVEMKCSADNYGNANGAVPKAQIRGVFISTSRVEEQIEILCLKPPKKCYLFGSTTRPMTENSSRVAGP